MSVSCAHAAHPLRPEEVFSLGKPAGAEGLSLRNKAFREVECLWLGNCSWQKVQCEAGGEKLKLLVFIPLAWGRAQCPVLPCPFPRSQKFILGTKQTRQSYLSLLRIYGQAALGTGHSLGIGVVQLSLPASPQTGENSSFNLLHRSRCLLCPILCLGLLLFLMPLSERLVLFRCAMKTKMPNPDFLRKCDLFFLRQPMGRALGTPRSRADTLPARGVGVQLQCQLCLGFSLSPRMSDCPSVT